MTTVRYCSTCGTKLETRTIDGVERLACSSPDCSFVHWGSYSVGVGALLVRDGKVLLVRRAQEPGKGYWTNPGGYIEQHEPIETTIEREVEEEAGVVARAAGIVAVRDQPRDVHNVYIAFAMEYVSGEPKPDNREVDAAGFFGPEEMAEMNVAPFTRWLVDVALNGRSDGLERDERTELPIRHAGLFKVATR
ncbi:NUDIX hydrolase [Paenibacillus flagellatus]|uniref:NUDIX hydrolase n=1 Tax=Paenibacillus flagellatus TaxID=2211139 RepID=A0A2V5K6Z4_9BACL|nr:NUDIX hydrolase [Paenibacillus flagellatus]PYI55219.1 NUDIX hydrolase [Paenibacillus flagellatus]